MNLSKKLIAFLMLVSLIIMQSCSEDSDLLGTDDPTSGVNGNLAGLDSDVVEDWSDLFIELDRYATGMRPNATARAIAYIYLTSYETAVPGTSNFASNQETLQGLVIDSDIMQDEIDFEIAINKSLSVAIDYFLFNLPDAKRAKIVELEANLVEELASDVDQSVLSNSNAWGEYVAQQVIAYANSDLEAEQQITEAQPLSYEPPTGDGFWTYSAEAERALFPYWESVRTFIVASNETTSIAPLEYSENQSSAYFQQMMEVYEVNNAAKEDDNEDLWIAEFWSDDVENLMFSPPARQVSIANQILETEGLDLDESLYLMLKLGFSLNDAAVSTWKYKYEHMVMRPNVFIHEFIDPTFQTNLFRLVPWPNPTFPGYPSGHSTFASAAAGVFIDFFGDNTSFTDRSHEGRTEFRGDARTFDNFSHLAEENAFSRIPLGVHVRMDCAEGLRLGYEIADGINEYDLRR